MNQFARKVRAAARYARVTRSVFRIESLERANRFLASHGWRRRPLTLPLSIVVRTTERCFLRCRMCGQNGTMGRLRDRAAGDRMRIEDGVYEALCEELASWPMKPFVKFTGGEPLLEWKVLRPAIERMRGMGCGIKVNTNGVMLRNPRLAEEVVRAGVDYLSVSIDGNEETHSAVRGVASAFGNARKGVHNVLEARRRLGTRYPMVLMSCVISTVNEPAIIDMIEVAREFGVDWLNMQFLNYVTPERSRMAHEQVKSAFNIDEEPWRGFEIPELARIDAGRLSRNLRTIKAKAHCPVSTMKIGAMTEENIRRFHYTDEVVKHHMCHMPYVTAFVVPPGEAVFCIDYPYYRYGDLRREQLRDAWFGEKAQAFRDAYIEYYRAHGKNFPQCLRCNWPYNT